MELPRFSYRPFRNSLFPLNCVAALSHSLSLSLSLSVRVHEELITIIKHKMQQQLSQLSCRCFRAGSSPEARHETRVSERVA